MSDNKVDLSEIEVSAKLAALSQEMEKAGVSEELGLVIKEALKPLMVDAVLYALNTGSAAGATGGYVHAMGIMAGRMSKLMDAVNANDMPEERRSNYKRLLAQVGREIIDILKNSDKLLKPIIDELHERSFDVDERERTGTASPGDNTAEQSG